MKLQSNPRVEPIPVARNFIQTNEQSLEQKEGFNIAVTLRLGMLQKRQGVVEQ